MRKNIILLLLSLVPPSRGLYNITTGFNATTGADGNIFTIKAKAQPIAIKRFDINMAGPPASLEIYFLPGVDPGRKDKNYVYQKIFEGIVGPGLGRNNVTSLPELINPVFIPAGASYSFYITFAKFASLHMQTKRGLPVGSVIISDEYTEVLEGYGMLYPFESYSPGWRWNGNIFYSLETATPTSNPTMTPTPDPTTSPPTTNNPSMSPTLRPTTLHPTTSMPTTSMPTSLAQTPSPTASPPTSKPTSLVQTPPPTTKQPTPKPTSLSQTPTKQPTLVSQTPKPTIQPTFQPPSLLTSTPTGQPTTATEESSTPGPSSEAPGVRLTNPPTSAPTVTNITEIVEKYLPRRPPRTSSSAKKNLHACAALFVGAVLYESSF